MSRATLALASFTVLGLALLSTALTRPATAGYGFGFGNDDSSRLRWALIDGDRNNSTNLSDPDDLEELKSTYGSRFLYIRDGDDRYVIKDRRMMDRARESMKPVQEAGREIGKAVGEKVSYSMRRSGTARERARLERRLSRIESRIARLSDRDEDADGLEDERQELENQRQALRQQLDAMKNNRRVEHDAEERQADLDAATERASRHMREAARKMDQTMRDILKESKSRHLAEPVE